jgi:hypothetical protein
VKKRRAFRKRHDVPLCIHNVSVWRTCLTCEEEDQQQDASGITSANFSFTSLDCPHCQRPVQIIQEQLLIEKAEEQP